LIKFNEKQTFQVLKTWKVLVVAIKMQFVLFWLAISFYTRLPCPQNLDYSKLSQATRYLPIIGWLVGGVSAASFYLAYLLWTPIVAVLMALAVGIFLTGAFHEDGLADVCDGFGGGWQKAHILEIMKDSRVGTYGALSLVFIIFLKINTLSTLPVADIPLTLLAGHSLSRFAPLWLMSRYIYAREHDSKVKQAMYQPNRHELLFAAICALLPLFFLPALCVLAILPIMATTLFLGNYFYRHIGGYTGDCLGATQQITETVFYLSVSALSRGI
jgi:adenosylcobinamide-GDP ribazoletransferase